MRDLRWCVAQPCKVHPAVSRCSLLHWREWIRRCLYACAGLGPSVGTGGALLGRSRFIHSFYSVLTNLAHWVPVTNS